MFRSVELLQQHADLRAAYQTVDDMFRNSRTRPQVREALRAVRTGLLAALSALECDIGAAVVKERPSDA